MKKIHKPLLTLLLVFCILTGFCVPMTASAAADPSLSGRNDFIWGVNGHNSLHYPAYPEHNLEQQIRLAAELGVKMYRFNLNPSNVDDLEYMDRVVALADAYGMELMLVLDGSGDSIDVIRNRFYMVASRYNGKKGYGLIRYFQVFNEVDIGCIKSAGVDGSDMKNHYDLNKLEEMLPKFEAALEGLKKGNPNCKSVINFSYLHTGFLDFLVQSAVEWDIIGLDWYSNMGNYDRIIPKLLDKYPHDIIICETNWWPESGNDKHNTDTTYLPSVMKQLYRYDHKKASRIKGVIFYELLDEMNYEASHGSFNGESHFGLIKADAKGNIGAKKPVYTAIQKLLGGGKVTPTYASKVTTKTTTQATTKSSSAKPTQSADSQVSITTANGVSTSETQGSVTDATSEETTTESGSSATTGSTVPAGTPSDNNKAPIWPFIAIPVGVVVIGGGVFLLLRFRFGMFMSKK